MPGASTSKPTPAKCRKCAMLSAQKAKELHGENGDKCWNPAVCYSRRSHARHRDRRNQTRNMKRAGTIENITVDIQELSEIRFATLIVYRPPGESTPVHAVGAEIWQGQKLHAKIQPIHCVGMVRSQILSYVKKMLEVLRTNYGIKKFASQERLNPDMCPIRPCPHNPML
ncbi:MAG: hypothetical protein HC815_27350 [Richelia sp. RM1_1_1]|nr:hypothetical protein [Richelia sp. RM1_1_1]